MPIPMAGQDIRLLYFDIRGLAEPVRWMMKIADVEFNDDRIPLDAWATGKRRTDFIKRRSSGGENQRGSAIKLTLVGQLPILFFNDFILTQPFAVLRFLAKKFGFCGETPMEEARAEEVTDLVYDLRVKATEYEGKAYRSKTPDIARHTVFRDLRNSKDTKEKAKMIEDFTCMWFPLYFSKFNELMMLSEAKGGEWIAGGNNMTYGDLMVANLLDICIDMVDPDCLKEFPKLKDLMDRVFAIPAIQEFRLVTDVSVSGKEEANE